MSEDEDYWFRARDYGYGAGRPTSWKGWALMVTFLVVIFGGQWLVLHLVPEHDWTLVVGLGVVFVGGPFVWLIWWKTEGHWRGRD